jgi:hypothetical protein
LCMGWYLHPGGIHIWLQPLGVLRMHWTDWYWLIEYW